MGSDRIPSTLEFWPAHRVHCTAAEPSGPTRSVQVALWACERLPIESLMREDRVCSAQSNRDESKRESHLADFLAIIRLTCSYEISSSTSTLLLSALASTGALSGIPPKL